MNPLHASEDRKKRPSRSLLLLLALAIATTPVVLASPHEAQRDLEAIDGAEEQARGTAATQGGVSFTNRAGEWVDYRRAKRANFDQLQALREASLEEPIALADLPFLIPGRFHGLPGVALFDFDNDGDLDIYVTNGPGRANSLLQNLLVEEGELALIDVAAQAGVESTDQDSEAVCYGDIDNDGDEDLVVTGVDEANRLFVNNSDGTFTFKADSHLDGGDRSTAGCGMGDVMATDGSTSCLSTTGSSATLPHVLFPSWSTKRNITSCF